MKYLSLLLGLVVAYVVLTQMGSTNKNTKSAIAEAQAEAAKVNPTLPSAQAPSGNSAAAPTTTKTAIRQSLDKARELNGLVKQRNGAGEF